ncbi:MAG TPA: preprotein translocase subunit SecE, partial [Ruminococcaceae bacterium]|nr:preprotein translocase subunit SecE [Oscillospiraceae bacterium]
KEKTSKKPNNKPNVFVRMGKAIKNFFKNSKGDLKKITWPGAKEVLKGTVVTIVCIAIVGVLVFLVDLGLTKGIKGLRTAAENRTTTTVAETTTAETTTANSLNIVDGTTAAQ